MSRFIVGDELGNIKLVSYSKDTGTTVTRVNDRIAQDKSRAIQQLAIDTSEGIVAAHADGSISRISLDETESKEVQEYTAARFKNAEDHFVGLACTQSDTYSCASTGSLKKVSNENVTQQSSASLPTRLCAWKLSPDEHTFAYGGNEVDLSLWSTSEAFQASTSDSNLKRKRTKDLFPGEIWRAKNVSNDVHGLRQPVHIKCLAYASSSGSNAHLLTGTRTGAVRYYDTRAGKRPVSDWSKIAKNGGIRSIEKGPREHEVFAADDGTSLFALDSRTGGILYAYKGISGAVTSFSPSSNGLCSVGLDRYVRIYSTVAPPTIAKERVDLKGQEQAKEYLHVIPTIVIWNGVNDDPQAPEKVQDDDDVWEDLAQASSDEDEDDTRARKITR